MRCVLQFSRVKIDSHYYRPVGNTSWSATQIVYIILYFFIYFLFNILTDVWADNTINTINNNNNNHITLAANMTPTECTGDLDTDENKTNRKNR